MNPKTEGDQKKPTLSTSAFLYWVLGTLGQLLSKEKESVLTKSRDYWGGENTLGKKGGFRIE